METKILVTYASIHGSTREIAEAMADELRQCGLLVDLQAMRQVKSLVGYVGVVLGAPLYMFHWHSDAQKFLKRHQNALQTLPVAAFGVGPCSDKEEDWTEIRAQFKKELAKFPWFAPAMQELFGGKLDPYALRFPYNLIPAMKSQPASDARDWKAIRAWSRKAGALLNVQGQ